MEFERGTIPAVQLLTHTDKEVPREYWRKTRGTSAWAEN